MPKLVSMRVVVSADDSVQTTAVMDSLRRRFEAMETELIDNETPRSRVHWASAEVLQGAERSPATRRTLTRVADQPPSKRGVKAKRASRAADAAQPLPA